MLIKRQTCVGTDSCIYLTLCQLNPAGLSSLQQGGLDDQ